LSGKKTEVLILPVAFIDIRCVKINAVLSLFLFGFKTLFSPKTD